VSFSPAAVLARGEPFKATWPGTVWSRESRLSKHFRTAVRRQGTRLPRRRHGVPRRQTHGDTPLGARAPHDVGYRSASRRSMAALGGARAMVGLVTGCFTRGTICAAATTGLANGAEFTRTHVSRGARLPAGAPPVVTGSAQGSGGLGDHHFTGYEDRSRASRRRFDARDITAIGHLLARRT